MIHDAIYGNECILEVMIPVMWNLSKLDDDCKIDGVLVTMCNQNVNMIFSPAMPTVCPELNSEN